MPSLRSQLNSSYEPVNFDQLTCDDLGQAVKIYIDAEIFSMETNRKEDVIPAIERCDYVYQYCFTYQQVPYEVTFSVGQPVREEVLDILTEEQIQDLYAKEGHWIIGPYGVQEERRAYQEIVQQQVEQTGYAPADPHVYIIGGIPNMRQPAAFFVGEEEMDAILFLFPVSIQATDAQRSQLAASNTTYDDGIYDYDQIKQAVNQMPETSGYDGYGSIVIQSKIPPAVTLLVLAVLSFGVFLLVVWIRQRKTKV